MTRAIVALALGACAAAPVDPIGSQGAFRPEADEAALWQEAEREEARLLRAVARYEDAALERYLAGLAARVTPPGVTAAGGPAPRVTVIRDPALNAFALPHGRVYVHTGLLARLETEAQLAAVLAREQSHVIRRHALQATREARRWPGRPAPRAGDPPPTNPYRAMGLRVAALAAVDGHGRAREREADADAGAWLTASGLDAREAVSAWEILRREAPAEETPEPFFLGRPARLDERIAGAAAAARGAIPPAGAEAPFAALLRPVVRDNAILEARAGRFGPARAQIDRALRLGPEDPAAHVAAGDVARLEAQRAAAAAARADLLGRARQAYERAAALDPAYPEPWRQLGLLHYQQQEPALARAAFGRYLALRPDAADARRIREYIAELDR